MRKFQNAIYRFMYGRYGHDKLNLFLIIFTLILSILFSLFLRGQFLPSLLTYGLLIWILYRSMSKNHYRRRKELSKFMTLTRPIRSAYRQIKRNVTDKTYRYYTCPQCGQKVRVPRGKGKIEISCPSCRRKFTRKS